MDFEEGVNGTRRADIAASGVDPAAAARLISRAFCAQTFAHGFVHCDPHAANVLVRPARGGRGRARAAPTLVLLDHGLYRELDEPFRLEYARLWRAPRSPTRARSRARAARSASAITTRSSPRCSRSGVG